MTTNLDFIDIGIRAMVLVAEQDLDGSGDHIHCRSMVGSRQQGPVRQY